MIDVDDQLAPADLLPAIQRMWDASAAKIEAIAASSRERDGKTPVFTVAGKYQPQGWTEWTQGFEFGSALLQFDATGERRFLESGREATLKLMAPHVTHFGVHDHGFNNVSTYGALLRLMNEGVIEEDRWQRAFYELALGASGWAQANRWSTTADGGGYIYSFNGPHSLFVDTIRSCRALAWSHQLGHAAMGERDVRVDLLTRIVQHGAATARYNVWYGDDRDAYDIRGRTAHESIFNRNNGDFRCPSSQQGYSPFTTWTRGLAWAMVGFPEQLEWFATRPDAEFDACGGRAAVEQTFLKAARATCDFYLQQTPTCGVPYWDTGAPGLVRLGDYLQRPAEPFNDYEPVDSSAAAIACQGLLRLANVLQSRGDADAARYRSAGLTVLRTLLAEPYLAADDNHEGLLLHSIYHRPNDWDYTPPGSKIPCGEACMWGDYHLREVALYVQRLAEGKPYYAFFGPTGEQGAAA